MFHSAGDPSRRPGLDRPAPVTVARDPLAEGRPGPETCGSSSRRMPMCATESRGSPRRKAGASEGATCRVSGRFAGASMRPQPAPSASAAQASATDPASLTAHLPRRRLRRSGSRPACEPSDRSRPARTPRRPRSGIPPLRVATDDEPGASGSRRRQHGGRGPGGGRAPGARPGTAGACRRSRPRQAPRWRRASAPASRRPSTRARAARPAPQHLGLATPRSSAPIRAASRASPASGRSGLLSRGHRGGPAAASVAGELALDARSELQARSRPAMTTWIARTARPARAVRALPAC